MPTTADLRAAATCARILLTRLGIGPNQPANALCRRTIGDLRRVVAEAYAAGRAAPSDMETPECQPPSP